MPIIKLNNIRYATTFELPYLVQAFGKTKAEILTEDGFQPVLVTITQAKACQFKISEFDGKTGKIQVFLPIVPDKIHKYQKISGFKPSKFKFNN